MFEGWVESTMGVRVGGVEFDTFDPDDQLVLSSDSSKATRQGGTAHTHRLAARSRDCQIRGVTGLA